MTTATVKQMPYESLFIVPAETSQEKIDEFVEKLKSVIASAQGTLRGVQVWGRRRLAYPIKRHKDGLYVYVDFDLDPDAVKNVRNLLTLSDVVIRHLTVDREEAPPRKERKPKPEGAAAPEAGAEDAAPAESAPSN